MLNPINVLLLVEDLDDDIVITKRKIARSHFVINKFLIARSLQETLDLLSSQNVDVILLDLNLPDSNGLDTLEKVRKIYNGTLIVLTSIDDEQIGIDAIRLGADEYLIKNQLTERLLSDSIYHAIERNKRQAHINKVQATLQKLESILK